MPARTTINSAAESANPTDAIQAENARLQALAENPPLEIVTVSDLHLGRGRDAATGRFSRTENFLADEAFRRLLNYITPSAQKLLFLNGDTFDFTRIFECPRSAADFAEWSRFLRQLDVVKDPAELQKSISRTERRFGLGTEDYKCAWKLLQIASGHREFFQALARWINGGGLLVVSKGNHDLELYWPLTRKAFCVLLQGAGAQADALSTRMFYCDDSVRFGNVYFEHGHKYDPQQRIVGGPVLADTPSELSLPLGIFVNRYLINPLEKLEPFLGSIRPTERILWLLLRRYPVAAIAVLFRSLRFIRRAFQTSRVRDFFWYAVYIGSIALPPVTILLIVGLILFAHGTQLFSDHPRLSTIMGILGLLAPYLASAFREFVRWLGRKRQPQIGEDDMAKGVYKTIHDVAFPQATRIYAVMGHTHDQDVQSLPDIKGANVLYLNTGTWIPVWPDDRPDLNGHILFPFIHFRRDQTGEYRHQYHEWRDDRGAPAESYILAPAQN
jgi:UDP-2,3-diacylglucosamine pyrophosphatase LpxH